MNPSFNKVAVIVAHPDDETLWSGGLILNNPHWDCFIASLCRRNDPDRSPKFNKVLEELGANGTMGDLDDGPEQFPLPDHIVEETIMSLLPSNDFDLVITHSIHGEYTRHRRHEEIGKAIIRLWHADRLRTKQMWAFAFEDGKRTYLPVAIKDAPLQYVLADAIWKRKYHIITGIYGFKTGSWEARCTPATEAFRQFFNPKEAFRWLQNGNIIS